MDSGVPTVDGRGCPSDDELAGFVEHALDAATKRRIEAHLDRCATCREAVGHVASTRTEEPLQIGRYRLDKKLGEGGMGVVWQAWDPALEREIAIKLLHPELHDPIGRERALREARALARLSHPNVVAVHDVGEHEGDVFIATELIDGQSLDRWQVGKSVPEILAAYAQAARGLAAAHAIGLVHRDVKPSNILVARDGRVRVGDFGLATNAAANSLEPSRRSSGRAPLPNLTHDGERLGTPAYMAPEQQHSAAVDARADQYSLCLALAEALLGKQPPMDPTADALAESGVVAPWPAIARGLATRPSDRFADLGPLVAALEGTRPHPSARRVWIAGGLAVAAIAGVVAWRVTSRDPEPTAPAPAVASGSNAPPGPAPSTSTAPTWTWTTPTSGPWRLPAAAQHLAIVDAEHAVAIGLDGGMVIDIRTGAVTGPVPFFEDGILNGVISTGNRVIAYGVRNNSSLVAWNITLTPRFAATEIPMPDVELHDAGNAYYRDSHAVSGDGKKIAICMDRRGVTIRDAQTLAVIRVIKGVECDEIWFADASHVAIYRLLERKLVDIATGAVSVIREGAPVLWHGPNGVSLSQTPNKLTISRGGATVRTYAAGAPYESMMFTPDGKFVVGWSSGTLTIRPVDASGRDHKIELPIVVTGIALTNQTAVVVNDNVVTVIDLENGTMRHATGNLESIRGVAPRAGAVVVASDKLRVWREGKLAGTTDAVGMFATGAPTAPITFVTSESAGQWDPTSGEKRLLRTFGEFTFNDFVDQHGDDYAFNEGHQVFRGKGDAPPSPWFRYGKEYELVALDLVHERAAWKTNEALYVANLRDKEVWAFSVPYVFGDECNAGSGIAFAPDGNRFAVSGAGDVILFDMAARKRIGAVELPQMSHNSWQFLPTGELIFVGETEIAIWSPSTGKAVGWKPPLSMRPLEIGVDDDGTQVAIGYENGSLLWADLAQLRTHATPREANLVPSTKCADAKIAQPKLDELLLK